MNVDIALTREAGANDKLIKLLPHLSCVELPCIAFGPGADIDSLEVEILKHDLIAITSPQAANIFLNCWEKIGRPHVKTATVGKGTSSILSKRGIIPVFEPSDFTAESLSRDLPASLGSSILYPSSSLAENTLQNGLTSRGFKVTRLETYKTVPAVWTHEQHEIAKNIKVVTFASPSAVRTWVERCGTSAIAVVIGPTSAAAARKNGFSSGNIFAPEGSNGIEAWAELISKVAQDMA